MVLQGRCTKFFQEAFKMFRIILSIAQIFHLKRIIYKQYTITGSCKDIQHKNSETATQLYNRAANTDECEIGNLILTNGHYVPLKIAYYMY